MSSHHPYHLSIPVFFYLLVLCLVLQEGHYFKLYCYACTYLFIVYAPTLILNLSCRRSNLQFAFLNELYVILFLHLTIACRERHFRHALPEWYPRCPDPSVVVNNESADTLEKT